MKLSIRFYNELVSVTTQLKLKATDGMTDDITSREMFMKGIDYSYYYEQEDNV